MNETWPHRASLRRRRLLFQGLALGLLGPGLARATVTDTGLRWRLSGAQVLDAGRLHEVAEGRLHEGFELEARAVAAGADGLLPEARFGLSGQAFSPAQAMGAQLPGHWYLRGLWRLSPPEAQDLGPAAGRHQPGVLQGQFSATLTRNPWASPGDWQAELRMPSGRYVSINDSRSVQAMRAHGALSLNAAFDGELTLNLQTPLRGDIR